MRFIIWKIIPFLERFARIILSTFLMNEKKKLFNLQLHFLYLLICDSSSVLFHAFVKKIEASKTHIILTGSMKRLSERLVRASWFEFKSNPLAIFFKRNRKRGTEL